MIVLCIRITVGAGAGDGVLCHPRDRHEPVITTCNQACREVQNGDELAREFLYTSDVTWTLLPSLLWTVGCMCNKQELGSHHRLDFAGESPRIFGQCAIFGSMLVNCGECGTFHFLSEPLYGRTIPTSKKFQPIPTP